MKTKLFFASLALLVMVAFIGIAQTKDNVAPSTKKECCADCKCTKECCKDGKCTKECCADCKCMKECKEGDKCAKGSCAKAEPKKACCPSGAEKAK